MKIENYTLTDNTPWRLYSPEGSDKKWAVLWLQGFTSTIDGHSEGLVRMSGASNVPFAMLNYAGHGDHPVELKDATRRQQFEQVCAVYDELASKGFERIIVIGGSFGGYMAALIAEARNPEVVVLRAPANYKDEEFELPYSETTEFKDGEAKDLYRQNIDETYSNMATKSIKNYDGITYIMEHGEDSVIKANIPKSYAKLAKKPNYIVIRGLEHSPKTMDNPQEFFNIIERWIQTIIYVTVNDPTLKQ